VENNIVKTPCIISGNIPGVVSEVILELAPQLGTKIREVNIQPDQLLAADEAFPTNSIVEVMPLVAVNDKLIDRGKPGEIT
jgi:branched-chain amino acid aminotransferase